MPQFSAYHVFFNAILVFLLIFASKINLRLKTNKTKSYYFWFVLACSTFATFGYVTGDFYHYEDIFDRLQTDVNASSHLEPIYIWLVGLSSNNYYLWRLYVWGCTYFILFLLCKKINLNSHIITYTFSLIALIYCSSHRNTFGFMVLFSGVAVAYCCKHMRFSYILGGTLMLLSVFFHKSMYMYFTIAIIALVPLSKKCITASFILFPILYASLKLWAQIMLTFVVSENDVSHALIYLKSYQITTSVWGYIGKLIDTTPIVILVLSVIYIIIKEVKLPQHALFFARYTYYMAYISMLFYGQALSDHLSLRFWQALYLPLAIFIAQYTQYNQRFNRVHSFALNWLIFSNIYYFAYQLYRI